MLVLAAVVAGSLALRPVRGSSVVTDRGGPEHQHPPTHVVGHRRRVRQTRSEQALQRKLNAYAEGTGDAPEGVRRPSA